MTGERATYLTALPVPNLPQNTSRIFSKHHASTDRRQGNIRPSHLPIVSNFSTARASLESSMLTLSPSQAHTNIKQPPCRKRKTPRATRDLLPSARLVPRCTTLRRLARGPTTRATRSRPTSQLSMYVIAGMRQAERKYWNNADQHLESIVKPHGRLRQGDK